MKYQHRWRTSRRGLSSIVFGCLVAYTGSYNAPFIPMLALLCVGAVLWLKLDPTQQLVAEQPQHSANN